MSLRSRGGKWHYRFKLSGRTWTGETGLVATERNRKPAEAIELEAWRVVKLGKGSSLKLDSIGFAEAAEKFLTYVTGHHDKSNTVKRCKGSFASLGVFFKGTPVASITEGDVADFAAWRATGTKDIRPVKPVTIRHDLHNLSKFFKYAKKHNWTRDNPVLAEDIPSDKDAVRINPLSVADEVRYFQAAERFPKLHSLGRLMVLQGCRPEELLAVEASHVNLERRTLRIVEGKSDAAKRTLALRAESLTEIATLLRECKGVYLFCSERNPKLKLSLSTCENWHNRTLAATSEVNGVKVPGVVCVIYDLRHTFATRAANAGMNLATLAKTLGHSSLRSVMKYVHPSQSDMDAALLALDDKPKATEAEQVTPKRPEQQRGRVN